MNYGATYARLVAIDIDTAKQLVLDFLIAHGFRPAVTHLSQDTDTLQISARKDAPFTWTALSQREPQQVHCALSRSGSSYTRICLALSPSARFRVFTFGLLISAFLAVTLFLGLMGPTIHTVIHSTISWYMTFAFLFASSVVILGLFLILALTFHLLSLYGTFSERLYDYVLEATGGDSKLDSSPALPTDALVAIGMILLWIFILAAVTLDLVDFVPVFPLIPLVTIVIAVAVACRSQIQRVQTLPAALTIAVFFVIMGLAPLWQGAVFHDMSAKLSAYDSSLVSQPGTTLAIVTVVALTCFLFILPLVFFLILSNHDIGYGLVKGVDQAKLHPESSIRPSSKRTISLGVLVYPLWMVFSISNLTALLLAVSVLEAAFTGRAHFFLRTEVNTFLADLHILAASVCPPSVRFCLPSIIAFVMALYSVPVLVVAAILVRANIMQLTRYFTFIASQTTSESSDGSTIQRMIRSVSTFAGISPPRVRHARSLHASALVVVPPLPLSRPYLVLSEQTAKLLSPNELEAMLAHELGHLARRDPATSSLLTFLSRWTLFGEVFLAAVHDSYVAELEADRFTIRYLERPGSTLNRTSLLDLLAKLERQEVSAMLSSSTAYAITLPSHSDWLPSGLRRAINNYSTCSRWRRLTTDLEVILFLACHGWQATYFHIPFQQRIQAIRQYDSRAMECLA